MNRAGANIAGVYSVRPVEEASVSTPFRWDELDEVSPGRFTIETIFERIGEVGDVFAPVAEEPGQSLTSALEQLAPVISSFKITGSARAFPNS
jgi:DNA primase